MTEIESPHVEGRERIRTFLLKRGDWITGRKLPTTYLETLLPLLACYIGPGIFTSGSSFKKGGLLLGPILMMHISVIHLHYQHVLIKISAKIAEKETVDVFPSYGETVQYTFEDSPFKYLKKISKSCKIFTNICIAATEYGYCVVYLVFATDNFTKLLMSGGWHVHYRIMLSLIILPLWASTFSTNLKAFVPWSFISNLFIWIGVAMILYYTRVDFDPVKERILIANYTQIPLFIAITMYQFNGTTFILSIQKEMRESENYVKPFGVLNVGLFISVFLYLLVGSFAYWEYGKDIQASVLVNIPQKTTVTIIIKICIALAVLFTYSMHMYITFEITYPIFYLYCGPFRHSYFTMCVYKSFWIMVTYGLAHISQDYSTIIAFLGALSGLLLALVIPACLELAFYGGELTRYLICKNGFVIAFALFASVTGTMACVTEIVKEYHI